jgi:proline iminopeptidase
MKRVIVFLSLMGLIPSSVLGMTPFGETALGMTAPGKTALGTIPVGETALGMTTPGKTDDITVAPPVYLLQQGLEDVLFRPIKPYYEGHLKVSPIHSLWYAQFGNPQGVPVLVVHGGPGFSCSLWDMRFFDPAYYRIILVDQRGAGRSLPFGEMKENTTQDLIEDMERLRNHLGFDKWVLFGGSWGSALSVLYGEAHPSSCLGFILRGVFLATHAAVQQVWYGMRAQYPDEWEKLVNFLPESERGDLLTAFYKRVNDPDPLVHLPAARAFMKYDLDCAFALGAPPLEILENDKVIVGTARTFTHYCVNKLFLKDNQLLDGLAKIQHLSVFMINGRFDALCPLSSAFDLHKQWSGSKLVIVPDAGHSATEPGIAKSLVEATQNFKSLLSPVTKKRASVTALRALNSLL